MADQPEDKTPALPQRNSTEELPDALTILGNAAQKGYLEASKHGRLDAVYRALLARKRQSADTSSAPGPGEPGYSQDIRGDIANAIDESGRSTETKPVAVRAG